MKLSRYNNFVPYKEKYIGHNGLSNRYVVLEPDLFHLLEAARNRLRYDAIPYKPTGLKRTNPMRD